MYMGKSVDELQGMSLEAFAQLTTSRLRRSLLRGMDKNLLESVMDAHAQLKAGKTPKPVKTHRREFVIIPQMIGLKMAVHKGNAFDAIDITSEMLGHRIGEFVLTRKAIRHGKAGIGSTKSSSAVTAK